MLITDDRGIATLNIARASTASIAQYVIDGATCLRLNGAFLNPEALIKGIGRARRASMGRARLILWCPAGWS